MKRLIRCGLLLMFVFSLGCIPPESFTKLSTLVPMQDGTQIAVDAFVPTGCEEPCEPPFPVVMAYTPYKRSTADPIIDFLTRERRGKIQDASDSEIVQLLLSNGYAFVRADMRGSGASSGWRMDFMPAIMDDGKEIVDWIAAQSWCDGNVGMIGGSYLGWSQLAVASRAPEALKCIMPTVVPFEGFSTEAYPGGIYSYSFIQLWSAGMFLSDRNIYVPGATYPTVPAFDEDGDGRYVDEIPFDRDLSGTFMDDYPWPVETGDPPQYLDREPRTEHSYFNATMEHAYHPDGAPGDYDMHDVAKDMYFINTLLPVDNLTAYDLLNNLIPLIIDSGIPVYNSGGWFDGFCRGTTKLYATMKDTNPSKMIMQPNYHGTISQGFADYFGVDPEEFSPYSDTIKQELLRWHERWLKGIDNGIESEAPIKIYVMNGKGWREENEWPLARQTMTSYYFEPDGKLATSRTADGTDNYTADFTHKSGYDEIDVRFMGMIGKPTVTDTFYSNRYTALAGFTPKQLAIRTHEDQKCLTYTSGPMAEDTEVTGHPIVHLWMSSTADHGDLFFYLEDVDETGEAVLVTENPLRIGFAGTVDDDEQIKPNPGVEVLPDLPWHGFEDAHYVDGILAGANVVEVVNDLYPTSWVFRQGHRIRISIACSDWPTFRLNPHLYAGAGDPTNIPSDYNAPTITVYRDGSRPSHIALPVIP